MVMEGQAVSVDALLKAGKQKSMVLTGQIERNQGLPTFTGRMTFDQFAESTVVHNRRWAEDAGEGLDVVTQREIIEGHVSALATFILKGLIAASITRAKADGFPASAIAALGRLQDRIGVSEHYALPPVTLVLSAMPEVRPIEDGGEAIAARLILPAGKLFVVADGQHRREAVRKVREFLNEVIANRRTPKGAKFYPAEDAPVSSEELEAWITVQETFRTSTTIAYEAHLGLEVSQAKQMFTNYNCNVRPVKAELNLEFDQSNPINRWAKEWLVPQLAIATKGKDLFDLRNMATINGFLFLGKTSIRSAPFSIQEQEGRAREFWSAVFQADDWKREGSRLREVPVLKGLAKAWFQVFCAKRNRKLEKAAKLREYIRTTIFDDAWVGRVPSLATHTVPAEGGGVRFSPAHNDIVAAIVTHALS
jgi:hypothetical protein